MSHEGHNAFRPAKISKELANAAYDDFKRKAVDEAKKRAVAQRVDYDTFKNMVLTAHLKPITAPKVTCNDKPFPCWSFGADGKVVKAESVQSHLIPSASVEAPSTSGDFYRDWRRNHPTPDDKYRYLKLCGPNTLRAVFRVEVSAEVLKEVLVVLETCWLSHAGAAEEAEGGAGSALHEAAFVAQLLEALSASGRFSLTVKLLGASTKPVLERLFAGLESAAAATAVDEAAEPLSPSEEDTCAGQKANGSGMCTAQELAALRKAYGLIS